MVLKKIDNRIRVLIENGVQQKHRTFFVIVGDKAKDQVSYPIYVKGYIIYFKFIMLQLYQSYTISWSYSSYFGLTYYDSCQIRTEACFEPGETS